MQDLSSKILVTGGTGMLGAHLIWHLLQEGFSVRATKRKNSSCEQVNLIFSAYADSLDNYKDSFEWVVADVSDYASIENAIVGVEYVFHCAAVVSLSKKTSGMLDINIRGTQNIVSVAQKQNVKKFCFVSSIASLGKALDGNLIDENTERNSALIRSTYAESKYLSERVVWEAIENGLNAVIVNPGVILGTAEETNNSMQIFSAVKKGLPIYTKGVNGYVAVQDVCRAMIELTKSDIKSERFVLVGENASHQHILNLVAKSLGKRAPFINGTRILLLPIAFVMEITAKILSLQLPVDRATVKVALSRSYYSSEKIKKAIAFQFTPLEKCVQQIAFAMKL